jgi:hypothetical protein
MADVSIDQDAYYPLMGLRFDEYREHLGDVGKTRNFRVGEAPRRSVSQLMQTDLASRKTIGIAT